MTGIWVYVDTGFEPYIMQVDSEEHASDWAYHMMGNYIYFFAELTTV